MISSSLAGFLDSLREAKKASGDKRGGDVITVNQITGKAGAFYEKIRYMVDYKDEHTVRRSAIERILKRKILLEQGTSFGLPFLQELVSGGYLPNGKISEVVATDIDSIVKRMFALKAALKESTGRSLGMNNLMLSLAGTEIDSILFPAITDELLVDTLYTMVRSHIVFPEGVSEDEKNVQTYIACRRVFLKNDDPTILYYVWQKYVPDWKKLTHSEEITIVADHAREIRDLIKAHLDNPLAWQLVSRLKNYGIYFTLLREIFEEDPVDAEAIIRDPNRLKLKVADLLERKYKKENTRVRKSSFRAVIYVLCTKIILAFAIELPYDAVFLHHVEYVSLIINILFHPTLLLVMTRLMKTLGPKNTALIISGMTAALYDDKHKKIKVRSRRGLGIANGIFFLLYGAMFLLTFGIIVTILRAVLEFNPVSIFLFVFFLTFVSYFGLRIRYTAKALMVLPENEGILPLIVHFFTLPIVQAGRFLSKKFSSVNIFVFFMDFILETPFKLILSVFDSFIQFLKEKREEIY